VDVYYLELRISKILTSYKTTLQVSILMNDGCLLSYYGEKDIDAKISNSLKAVGLMNVTFNPLKFQKYPTIKVHNTLRVSAL
jgi:hypothetical protein